ncbi:MAG TPA: hypothetical protein VLA37_02950 [Sphingomonadaceae bacterium]|nr:hypothetical protein [Sphingomonadaceae bacterium]
MNTFLIIVLVGLMIMVVVSLVRGIIAFLQTTRQDIDAGGDGNIREMQLKQNQMMFARIKYQALAVGVVFILLMISR